KEDVHVAHIGDSRCYRLRGGALEPMTRDHSLVNELLDHGMLKPEEVAHFPNKHIITRAIGQEKDKPAEHKQFKPEKGDVLLLCSDGVSNELTDDRIAEILRAATADNLQDICDQLIAAANAAGGRDNVTVVLAIFS